MDPIKESVASGQGPYDLPVEVESFDLESFQNLSGWCSTSSRSPLLESVRSPSPKQQPAVQETTSPILATTGAEGDFQTLIFDFEDELDYSIKSPVSLFNMRSELISTNQPQQNEVLGECGMEKTDFANMIYEDKKIKTSCPDNLLPDADNILDTFSELITEDDKDDYQCIAAIRPQDMHFQNDNLNVGEIVVPDLEIPEQEVCVQIEEPKRVIEDARPSLLCMNESLEHATDVIRTPDVIQLIDGFDLISYLTDGNISASNAVESGACSSQSVPSSVTLTIPDIVVLEGKEEVLEMVNDSRPKSKAVRVGTSKKRKSDSAVQNVQTKRPRDGEVASKICGNSRVKSRRPPTEKQKYREMRDRNNEASRKSRQSRKERDAEMVEKAEELEKLNKSLKLKVESLESLRDTVRQLLFKSVKPNANPE